MIDHFGGDGLVRVALYARVSLDEKAEDRRYQEPENQLEPLREYAKNQDWEIVGEYVDRVSGGNSNRPEFKRLLADAHQSKFKVVLVWKLDRFSREGISNTLHYVQDLKRFKVGLVSMTEQWCDTREDNPIGDLLISMMAWFAAEERRKISERTKAGIQRLRNIGQYRGGRPRKTPPSPRVVLEQTTGKGDVILGDKHEA